MKPSTWHKVDAVGIDPCTKLATGNMRYHTALKKSLNNRSIMRLTIVNCHMLDGILARERLTGGEKTFSCGETSRW